MNTKKQHIFEFDYIRVLAMLFVICVHVGRKPFTGHPYLFQAWRGTLMACNGFFFMMSGALNLGKPFETRDDYIRFYKKRISSLVIPYVVGIFLALTVTNILEGNTSLAVILKDYVKYILVDSGKTAAWYINSYFGAVLVTPFLAKMLKNMNRHEQYFLLGLTILYRFISLNIYASSGRAFPVNLWILQSWLLYYVGGYIIMQMNIRIGILLPVMISMLSLNSFFVVRMGSGYVNKNDLNAIYTVFVMTLFMSLLVLLRKWNRPASRIIKVLAHYSYFIYIFHYFMESGIESLFSVHIPQKQSTRSA